MKRPKKKRRFMDRIMRSTEQTGDDSNTSSDEEPKEEGDESMNGSDDKEYNEQDEREVEEQNTRTEEHEDSSESTSSGESAATGQRSANTSSESHEEKEEAEDREESSSDSFGRSEEDPIDEIVRLLNDTDLKSEVMQKRTGKVLSAQSKEQPDLLNKLKERKDVVPHRETVKRWKQAGDASHKLEQKGMDTATLGTWQLQELSKAPSDEIMFKIAREAIAEKLTVREIRKRVSPLVKKAKMEASGALTDMGPRCVEIIEALDQPEKLMEQTKMVILLQDSDRLKREFTFTELSRIHEKANTAETKIEKQKRALEEKGSGYVPVINFLRLIRKTISAAYVGETS